MTRAYKITRLPDGYCKVAVAAWKALGDRELFEIEGKLVFTDDLEAYLEEETTSISAPMNSTPTQPLKSGCCTQWPTGARTIR